MRTFTCLFAIAALALSACGGSGSDTATTAAPASSTATTPAASATTSTPTASAKAKTKTSAKAKTGSTTAKSKTNTTGKSTSAKKAKPPATSTVLPANAYLQRVNAVCRGARKGVPNIPRPHSLGARYAWLLGLGQAEAAQMQSAFRVLPPPARVRAAITTFVQRNETLLAFYSQLRQAKPPEATSAIRKKLAAIEKRRAAAAAAADKAHIGACAPRLRA